MSDYTEQLRAEFASHLEPLGVSHNTYKNYLSDILNFFNWQADQNVQTNQENIAHNISTPALVLYRDFLISHCPVATANRRLSSLRKFCQFLFSKNLLPSDPSATITNISQPVSPQETILSRFRSYLKTEGSSAITIKNYLSDARHFMNYSPDLSTPLPQYHSYLQQNFSPSTALRRLSSARKLLQFLSIQPQLSPAPPPPPAPEFSSQDAITQPPAIPEPIISPAPEVSEPPSLINLLSPDTPSPVRPETSNLQPPPSSQLPSHPTPLAKIYVLIGIPLLILATFAIAYFLSQYSPPTVISP